MRLLVFAPYLAPHVGGVESYIAQLDDVLLAASPDVRITVLAPDLPAGAPAREQPSPRRRILRYPAFEPIPNFPLPNALAPSFWSALQEAWRPPPDLVVCHTRFFPSSALAVASAARHGVPVLHVEHGSDHVQLERRMPRAVARAYDATIGRWVVRRADAVVAVSGAAAAFVERLGRPGALVIHRGLDSTAIDNIRPDLETLEWAAGRPVVVYVGRLIDSKGVRDLVRAFSGWRSQTAAPGVLCLVGEGPERPQLEQLAEANGLADDIRLLGQVSHGRALALLAAADVVVNPSYTEGLPTVVLEAATMGRAVVATDVGGTREIISDRISGILVPPRDTTRLQSALGDVLGDRAERDRLARAARASARELFRWDRAAQAFLGVAARTARSPSGATGS